MVLCFMKFVFIGASLSEPHTSESPPQNWCYRPCTKNYDKNRVTYACDENSMAQITARPYVIVHATISDTGFGVIVHATISERRRLQCFHIWFGVIVHATISERCRLVFPYMIWCYRSCHDK